MKSNNFLVFILCLFIPFGVNAQIKLQTYTTATDTFYWKRYIHIPKPPKLNLKQFSVSNRAKKIDSFLAKYLDQFPQFTSDSMSHFNLTDLKKCLYPVDIDGDQLPDMIFSGFSGGEGDLTRIYRNRNDSFELIFEDYQYITKFVKKNGKLVELQTGDVGTGDNYLYFTRDYRVNQLNGAPEFIKVKQNVVFRYTEEPFSYYPHPIPFIAKKDTLLLRASAAQLNEPFIPYPETFGNIVAKYRTRARGIALAYKTYGNGNNWYYVEIFPDASPTASILYDLDKMPTFVRGWVSGQAILLDLK